MTFCTFLAGVMNNNKEANKECPFPSRLHFLAGAAKETGSLSRSLTCCWLPGFNLHTASLLRKELYRGWRFHSIEIPWRCISSCQKERQILITPPSCEAGITTSLSGGVQHNKPRSHFQREAVGIYPLEKAPCCRSQEDGDVCISMESAAPI